MRILLLLLIPFLLYGQVTISSISIQGDTLRHGYVLTINGSGFGTKSPAAPLIWDDCETAQLDDPSEPFARGWTETHPYTSVPDTNEWQYHDSTYRNIGHPHTHGHKIGGGMHWLGNLSCADQKDARDVCVTKAFGAQRRVVFAMWYKRLDPLWADPVGGADYNYKDWVVQDGPTAYYGNVFTYCGVVGNYGPSSDSTAEHMTGGQSFPHDQSNNVYGNFYSYSDYPLKINRWATESQYRDDFESYFSSSERLCGKGEKFNEATGWMKQEVLLAANDVGLLYEKGYPMPEYTEHDRGAYTYYQDSIPFFGWGGPSGSATAYTMYQSFTIGGYHRTDLCDGGYWTRDDDGQWFDDMYIDTVLARVLLTDKANYHASKYAEIQIPVTWSNTQITCTVNLGILDSPRADLSYVYLWVFNRDNQRNSTGYQIPIYQGLGGGGGGTPANQIEVKLHRIGN